VLAGLKGDVNGGACGIIAVFPAVGEGVDFGVRAAEFFVPAFADDMIGLYDDAAYGRIGFDCADTAAGQVEGQPHVLLMFRVCVLRAHGENYTDSRRF
jgi:hypothetical protein